MDQPGTQAWKRRRLIELGYGIPDWLRLVPVDFEAGADWWEQLSDAGFDPGRPTVVTCTGVTMYLTKDATAATLRRLALLAPGSTLAVEFLMLQAELVDDADRPALEATKPRRRQPERRSSASTPRRRCWRWPATPASRTSTSVSNHPRRTLLRRSDRRPSPVERRRSVGGHYLTGARMAGDVRFEPDLYRGTAHYYDRFRLPYRRDDRRSRTPGSPGEMGGCSTWPAAPANSPSRCAAPAEVWCVDAEPDMTEVVRAKAIAVGATHIRAITVGAEDLPAQAGQLESIVIGNAFHRLRRAAVAGLAHTWLRPGGCLALCWSASPWAGPGTGSGRSQACRARAERPRRGRTPSARLGPAEAAGP